MAQIVFDIPNDIYHRIKKHPSFPKSQSGGAHRKYWQKLFLDGSIHAPAFRLAEVEAELQRTHVALNRATGVLATMANSASGSTIKQSA